MSLRIATNVQSLSAQRFLQINNDMQNKFLEQLSSGSRINHSGDDAAGLAISERLKSHIRSMKQATRNANDGISLIQVAEGSLSEIGNILVRLRELSIQGASDTIGDAERGFLDKEVQQLKSEIDRIANGTEFNGTKLLNGTTGDLEIQIGLHNNPNEDRFVFDATNKVTTLDALGLGQVSTRTKSEANQNLDLVDGALTKLSENRAGLGALQNRLMSSINNLTIYQENLAGANSRIRDTDMAEATSELVKGNILTQGNIVTLAQANTTPQLALKLLTG